MKYCPSCKQSKDESAFNKNCVRNDGLSSVCKICNRIYHQKYYQANLLSERKKRADRNRWVYDDKGRVIKLADPLFVKNFDKEVRCRVYKILKNEFGK